MNTIKEAVIIGAARTPVGKFLGSLKGFTAPELGAIAVREAVRRAGVAPEEVDEVIMGCVIQAGLGQNPARQAALRGGIPFGVSAVTINKVCGSGLKAVMMAAQGIQLGDTDIVVAGGMESMSNAPYLLPKAREGYRMGNATLVDSMIHDGLWCAFENYHMGNTGAPVLFEADESVREDTSIEALGKLKPAFRKEGGSVTAGNAPGVNDGASALVVTSMERARALGVEPMARIAAQATSGIQPELVMMAPVEAIRKVIKKAGWSLNEVDLIELNEAFSVQAIAIMRELELDPARVNVNGGAVALGHAIGQSGSRLLTTMLYEMRRTGARRGLAALCLGGGNAVALAVER